VESENNARQLGDLLADAVLPRGVEIDHLPRKPVTERSESAERAWGGRSPGKPLSWMKTIDIGMRAKARIGQDPEAVTTMPIEIHKTTSLNNWP
jgi:hypothetical protein